MVFKWLVIRHRSINFTHTFEQADTTQSFSIFITCQKRWQLNTKQRFISLITGREVSVNNWYSIRNFADVSNMTLSSVYETTRSSKKLLILWSKSWCWFRPWPLIGSRIDGCSIDTCYTNHCKSIILSNEYHYPAISKIRREFLPC